MFNRVSFVVVPFVVGVLFSGCQTSRPYNVEESEWDGGGAVMAVAGNVNGCGGLRETKMEKMCVDLTKVALVENDCKSLDPMQVVIQAGLRARPNGLFHALILGYTGGLYRPINGGLRDVNAMATAKPVSVGPKYVSESFHYTVKCMSSAINTLPKFSGKSYRGASLPEAHIKPYRDAFAAKAPLIERAYMSTSELESVAKNYAKPSPQDGKKAVIFNVVLKNGRKIGDFSAFPQEKEVVVQPGTPFTVNSITEAASVLTVTMTEQ